MSADQLTEVFVELRQYPGYRVSNWGRVQSCRPQNQYGELSSEWKDLKPIVLQGTRYLYVHFRANGKHVNRKIHHLVLEAFVGPCPDGMECRHLDGNPRNNRVDNLAWGTVHQNAADRARHGTDPLGVRNPRAILDEPAVVAIRRRYREGESIAQMARDYGVGETTIRHVVLETTWKHVAV